MTARLERLLSLLRPLDRGFRRHWLAALLVELVGVVLLSASSEAIESEMDSKPTSDYTGESQDDDTIPRVSVLMPAWNEGQTVQDAITGFLSVSHPDAELIVCAGGDDGTYEYASAVDHDTVVLIEQTSDMNKQAALNACLNRATGQIHYLIDGDCVLDTATWNATLRPILGGDEHVVTGGSRPHDYLRDCWLPTYQYVKEEFERARRPRYVDGILGRNVALSEKPMRELGSFDETIQAGTDYNLAKRLLDSGYEIRFARESRIRSEYPTTVTGYVSQQSRWLRNVFFLGREWDAADEVRATLVTCGVGVSMLIAPFVGVLFFPVLIGWAGLVMYGIATRYNWAVEFNETHEEDVAVGQFCLISLGGLFVEFAAGVYAVLEMMAPERRRKW